MRLYTDRRRIIEVFLFYLCLFFFLCFLCKKENESFTAAVPADDSSLVSVPPLSSQVDSRDKLSLLHSALLQCHVLLEKAVAKEVEDLGDVHGDGELQYEGQRKVMKERLSLLLINTGELLKAVDGAVQTPGADELMSSHR